MQKSNYSKTNIFVIALTLVIVSVCVFCDPLRFITEKEKTQTFSDFIPLLKSELLKWAKQEDGNAFEIYETLREEIEESANLLSDNDRSPINEYQGYYSKNQKWSFFHTNNGQIIFGVCYIRKHKIVVELHKEKGAWKVILLKVIPFNPMETREKVKEVLRRLRIKNSQPTEF